MKRRLIIWLSIPVIVAGLGILLTGWLLNSDSGSRWLLFRLTDSLQAQLSIGKVTGNFDTGLEITDFRFAKDGMELSVAHLEIVAGLSLQALQVDIRSLHADDLRIWLGDAEASSHYPPEAVENVLAGLKLPFAISMDDVTITGLELLDADRQSRLQLDRISFSGRWKDVIELQQLAIEAPSLAADLQGSISLSSPFAHQWTGSGRFNAGGPASDPATKLDFTLVLGGVSADYNLQMKAVLQTVGLPVIDFALTGQGDLEGLKLGSLDAESEFLQARATGMVTWVGSGSVDLDLEVARLEPALWISDWPGEQYIYGQASLLAEVPGIHVRGFNAKVAGTAMSLEGSGELDLQAEILDATLNWQNLGWPVGPDGYEISSDSGQLLVSGSPADWRFEGSLKFDTRQYPGGGFELEGGGGMDTAEIYISKGEALGGTLAGQASLDWRGALRWDAQLDVKQVNGGVFVDDWPVRLDAKLSLFQDTGSDLFELQFDRLHGEIQGRSVDGSGGFAWQKSSMSLKDIRLHSGSSKIFLDGDLEDAAGLEFALDVRKPGWMADYLGGEVSGRGRIALLAPQPVLDIELKAKDLEWGDIRIESISIAPGQGRDTGGFDLEFEAQNLEFGSLSLQNVQAVIGGDRNRQTLDINLNMPGYELAAKLTGFVSDWNTLASSNWSGHLTDLTLAAGQETLLSLQNPAPLTVAAAGISLDKACFGVTGAGGLCLQSRWQSNGRFDFSAGLSALSLGLSPLLLDHQIEFTQTLDGEIQWTRSPGQYPSGSAAIRISAGQFGDGLAGSDSVVTAEGFFGFKLANGNLSAGELDIPFPGIGQIDLKYGITDLALDGTGKVDGAIRIDLNDISVLERLVPGLEQIGGRLNANLQVSGVVSNPVFDGLVVLENGAVDIPYLGTQLRQIRLEGAVSGNDKASLRGEFKAGEGHGKISVAAQFSDWMAPGLDITLAGSSLRLLNTPELRLDADTDIRLAWRRGEWAINGGVEVQQARIAPVTFIVGKVVESDDIQLVAGSIPYSGPEKVVEPVRLSGNLEVSLGENVKIDTEQAKARLSGAVMLTWNGALIPIASGSIHADGTLSVFGPKLHVEDGQLRFPEVPVTNPLLDIRAERNVFGNTQVRVAGVSITGPARRPVIEAYTNPRTTRARAWALLITGNDVNYGQGIGAIEVGTYIAPRLYLSYGISLFDDDNIISARYDLKKGFGVKASSGQRESGIDMSYTIDR